MEQNLYNNTILLTDLYRTWVLSYTLLSALLTLKRVLKAMTKL